MELTELSLLPPEQLVNLINRATAVLDRQYYPLTHLYINALTAEPDFVSEDESWWKKTPTCSAQSPTENWWGSGWLGDDK